MLHLLEVEFLDDVFSDRFFDVSIYVLLAHPNDCALVGSLEHGPELRDILRVNLAAVTTEDFTLVIFSFYGFWPALPHNNVFASVRQTVKRG